MAKKKRYDDGGLTFADMSDTDRASAAKAAMEALNARQAEKSSEAGGMSDMKAAPRRMAKPKPAVSAAYRDEGSQGIAKTAAGPDAKTPGRMSLEEYSARSPWNTRGTSEGFSYSKGKTEDTSPSAFEDLVNIFKRAPRVMKKGGSVKSASASKRADGCAVKGKTKGRFV